MKFLVECSISAFPPRKWPPAIGRRAHSLHGARKPGTRQCAIALCPSQAGTTVTLPPPPTRGGRCQWGTMVLPLCLAVIRMPPLPAAPPAVRRGPVRLEAPGPGPQLRQWPGRRPRSAQHLASAGSSSTVLCAHALLHGACVAAGPGYCPSRARLGAYR